MHGCSFFIELGFYLEITLEKYLGSVAKFEKE
jgi:hypothetical protein